MRSKRRSTCVPNSFGQLGVPVHQRVEMTAHSVFGADPDVERIAHVLGRTALDDQVEQSLHVARVQAFDEAAFASSLPCSMSPKDGLDVCATTVRDLD